MPAQPAPDTPNCANCGARLDADGLCTDHRCPMFWPERQRRIAYWDLMSARVLTVSGWPS